VKKYPSFLHLGAGAAALPAVSHMTWAQSYPSRPITIIVRWGDGCDRAYDGRANENLPWSTSHLGGRDGRSRYDRRWPRRTRGKVRQLHGRRRQVHPRNRPPRPPTGISVLGQLRK
jgi:hypothetical protein